MSQKGVSGRWLLAWPGQRWRRVVSGALPRLAALVPVLVLGMVLPVCGWSAEAVPGGASDTRGAFAAEPVSPRLQDSRWFWPEALRERCTPLLAAADAQALQKRAEMLLHRRGIREASAWAQAALGSLCASGLPLQAEPLALVLAKIERESSFVPQGLLPNAPDGLRKLGYRLIDDLLDGSAPDLDKVLGADVASRVIAVSANVLRKFGVLDRARLRALFDHTHERFGWSRIRTEWQIEHEVAKDLLVLAGEATPLGLTMRAVLALQPEWREHLATGAVLRTLGPLQVGPVRSAQVAADEGVRMTEAQMRELLYTIEGGVYYGVRRLAPYVLTYTDHGPLSGPVAGFVAADALLGLATCRNEALLAQIARLAGETLAPGSTLRSGRVRELLLALELTLGPEVTRQRDLAAAHGATGKSAVALVRPDATPGGPGGSPAYARAVDDFLRYVRGRPMARTPLFHAIRAVYAQRFGGEPPLGLVPQMDRYSAKTGRFFITFIAADVERAYTANCRGLGCGL